MTKGTATITANGVTANMDDAEATAKVLEGLSASPRPPASGFNKETMNKYIATLDGEQIGQINDSVELHPIVMQTITTWLEHGLLIQLQKDTMTTIKPVAFVKPAKPAKPAKSAKKNKPVEIESIGDWSLSDKVYLKWDALPTYEIAHLSQYRNAQGVIGDFRRGAGIRKTVGVRFNSDPELTWFQPGELTRTMEVG